MLAPMDSVAVVVFVGLNVGLAVVDGEGVMEPEMVVVMVAEVVTVVVRLGVPVAVPVLDGVLVPVCVVVTVGVTRGVPDRVWVPDPVFEGVFV